jgi:hypothetical protein
MTEQEYRNRLRLIADDYADKKLSLSRSLAFSRNPVKPGNTLSGNSGGRIKVSSLKHPSKGDYTIPWSASGGALLKNRRYTT